MRIASLFCVLLVLGLLTSPVLADKEKADQYLNYPDLSGRATYPEVEPNDTCQTGQPTACGDVVSPAEINPATEDDWFTFYVEAGQAITTGTLELTGFTTVDTYIELWDTNCAVVLAEDDDGGPGLYSLISNFVAPVSGDYHVNVHHYAWNGSGYYQVFFECGGGPQPIENETCEGAETYGYFLVRGTAGSLNADSGAAIDNYSPTNGCTGYSQAHGLDLVWYMDLQAGDICTFIMTEQGFDAALYVLTDCANMNSCVVGADDPEEIHDWVVPATDRYYLVPDGYSTGAGGPFELTWDISVPTPVEQTTWSRI
jgi:hypothetical protein